MSPTSFLCYLTHFGDLPGLLPGLPLRPLPWPLFLFLSLSKDFRVLGECRDSTCRRPCGATVQWAGSGTIIHHCPGPPGQSGGGEGA